MKTLSTLVFILVLLTSCQNNHKKTRDQQPKTTEKMQSEQWILDEDNSSIHWTGYKTSGKIPVKGVFKTFKIKGVKPVTDLVSALQNAQAEINIYSIFSDNEERDNKLIGKLFENMTDTQNIYARIEKIEADGQSAMMTINMNAHEKTVPVHLQIDENTGKINLSGKIDLLKDFKATDAFEQFHKACFNQHKGKDDVSKTWSEVGFNAELIFKRK